MRDARTLFLTIAFSFLIFISVDLNTWRVRVEEDALVFSEGERDLRLEVPNISDIFPKILFKSFFSGMGPRCQRCHAILSRDSH